jgi:uncharacterized protein (DUF2235 family)
VLKAFHAVAIDERRKPFPPTLWIKKEDATHQTLEQVWFAGVHCDVGGGYRDPELSEILICPRFRGVGVLESGGVDGGVVVFVFRSG